MKLATEILEKIDKLQANVEAGDTSDVNGHWHKTQIDVNGNGKTIRLYPDTHPVEMDHEHEIVSWKVMPAGEDKHTHTVKA